MADETLRCFRCFEPLDPRDDLATVELNPMGNGEAGFHTAKVCTDCEAEVAEKMKYPTGGNI